MALVRSSLKGLDLVKSEIVRFRTWIRVSKLIIIAEWFMSWREV